MKIAIIGSREGITQDKVVSHLEGYRENLDVEFITGGARGVDSYTEEWCRINNKPIEIIRPINPSNKLDYLFRNVEIITKADLVIAFWDKKSKGTKFGIDYAKARNKKVEVYF